MNTAPLTCVDCGSTFEFSYSEQRYSREHRLELPMALEIVEGPHLDRGIPATTSWSIGAAEPIAYTIHPAGHRLVVRLCADAATLAGIE